jgi:Bardet-Biedl syndrome 7 protein
MRRLFAVRALRSACKDFHTILANDRINDLTAVFALPGAAEPSAVLACQDRTLRVLDGSEVVFEGQVDGPALTVLPFSSSAVVKAASLSSQFSTLAVEGVAGSPARRGAAGAELLYGTENGIFGQILLGDGAMRRGWEVGNRSVSTLANRAAAPRRAGGVTALCAHDLTHDGVPDVIVGRDDGTIQVSAASERASGESSEWASKGASEQGSERASKGASE